MEYGVDEDVGDGPPRGAVEILVGYSKTDRLSVDTDLGRPGAGRLDRLLHHAIVIATEVDSHRIRARGGGPTT
ncbi:hypothetical protein [Euzebya sp.]|uniref:hypothetical protein n=1 Tax=Euzebya sp. TaxID=1971409 RepID=UPI003517622D